LEYLWLSEAELALACSRPALKQDAKDFGWGAARPVATVATILTD
jgi:hypothetical protein